MGDLLKEYISANIHLAFFVVVAGTAALFYKLVTGGEYCTLVGGIFTVFHAGDIVGDYIRSKRPPDGDHH